jgi:hypothetical protein
MFTFQSETQENTIRMQEQTIGFILNSVQSITQMISQNTVSVEASPFKSERSNVSF